ncbi:MAG: agmatinase [Phycisphaerales bacterium]|nr:agmatinase [Phycisphaerales bacterium]
MNDFQSAEERFLGLNDQQARPDAAGCIVLPVPFERTSSFGVGSADGPRAILEASHEVELFDTELGFEPWSVAGGIATLQPLPISPADDGASIMAAVDRIVTRWREQNKLVVTIAGEHTGIVGAVRAHTRGSTGVTVLQLDAHSDLRESYLGDRWNHACALARVLDFHDDVVQVGIRSESREDAALAHARGVRVMRASEIHDDADRGVDWIDGILNECSECVYVTLDCDVFDPSVIPTTGTPEPGGLTWRQMNALLQRLCRERRVIGFDVSELAPQPGLHHTQFTIAKLIARMIGWISSSADQPIKKTPQEVDADR